MPTLKDIQEEGMSKRFESFWIHRMIGTFSKIPTTWEILKNIIKLEIKDFIQSETTLAYQAGEKEGNKVTLDIVLKEIEGMKEKGKHIGIGGLHTAEVEMEVNQALSSLKEKIISNSK